MAIISWFVLLAGCSPTGTISAEQQDAAPIKLPPQGKPGGDTVDGCNGVPASGRCLDGVAMYCDVANGYLRQVDCRALGQECVVDPSRGASCEDLGSTSTDEGSPCGGAVDTTGFCSSDGTAVWCDEQSDQIVAWDCQQDGLACGVDQCQSGAYCCDDGGAQPQDECETLGFYGECSGDVARYCTGSDTLVELDCAAQGKACAVDECATGAYCCDPPESPVNECAELGIYGECGGPDNNTVRYCIGDTLYERECSTEGESCVLEACFNGAECCPQTDYESRCQELGYAGTCAGPDEDMLTWCNDAGEIQYLSCSEFDLTCAVDLCSPGEADCC